MDIKDALGRYLVQIKADGRSEHTAGQYRRHITLLATWLEGRNHRGSVEEIDHETIAQFLASPAARERPDGKPKRATSTNALRTSLRTFFRFTHDAGYCKSNPARLIRRALCGDPPPRALSDADRGRLLGALASGRSSTEDRDHALFDLLLGSGIRIGSALALDVDDVDLVDGSLILRRAKGDAPAKVYLSARTRDRLRRWIRERTEGPLFPGAKGGALSARHVQRRLAHWCRKVGIRARITPHSLRHTFALGIYRRTRDLLVVKAALGHRSITSTCVYAAAGGDELRAVIEE